MLVHMLSIFPEFFSSPLNESMIKRAQEKGKVKIDVVNMRDFTKDKHKSMDDAPFGGEAGMVMMVEPLYEAIKSVTGKNDREKIILTSPQGERFDQNKAKELSTLDHLILVCGHYKGVDERIKDLFPMEEMSIGDYVLTGGEFAALVILDAVTRLIPGVIGKFESAQTDSFHQGILGYPQYTRPAEFRGLKVPEVLLSGDHEKVRLWRRKKALEETLRKRPDLLENSDLSNEDKNLIDEIRKEKTEGSKEQE
ncbi:MAG: tRNA (guanosine(37)-N1)-methyltransferase TrmD [Candidatus Zixiibacteriota bacterium]